ncbi:MAG: hypothetical protein LBO72_04320 [Helicobacteraceae bacterium]|nr:hypothetical protein [Helicobacteraceae bacterium]
MSLAFARDWRRNDDRHAHQNLTRKSQNSHCQSTLTIVGEGACAMRRETLRHLFLQKGESGFLRQNAKANSKLSYFEYCFTPKTPRGLS